MLFYPVSDIRGGFYLLRVCTAPCGGEKMWLRDRITVLVILAVLLIVPARVALAQDDDGTSPLDERCLRCHEGSDATTTFEDGEERSVAFDFTSFKESVHGPDNPIVHLSCYDCHGDYRYPHEGSWASPRDFRLDLNQQCERCHAHQAELQSDSTHARAMAAGNTNAAVCVDCHGSHNVHKPGGERANISQTCGTCHVAIFEQYRESVHGAALLDEANPDVPTCINCHGVHNIEDPTTALFRLKSPNICAKCHADDELMEKYGISTNVFESYVSDFHGKTVTLFQQEAPDAEVNQAVCYDCHGVHDIRAPDDPLSSVASQERLLVTCQKCHPNATANFSSAWLGHYQPDQEKYPVVYFVTLFYRVFIPSVLGFMGFVAATDIWRRARARFGRRGEGGEQ